MSNEMNVKITIGWKIEVPIHLIMGRSIEIRDENITSYFEALSYIYFDYLFLDKFDALS
jgi:hypothetical protein